MENLTAMTAVEYDEDLKKLLSAMRLELNLLNTLNCNVHKHQGDFSLDRDVALNRTEAANALYLSQLRGRVTPMFVRLGLELVSRRMVSDLPFQAIGDADIASIARRWYQENYMTGICW